MSDKYALIPGEPVIICWKTWLSGGIMTSSPWMSYVVLPHLGDYPALDWAVDTAEPEWEPFPSDDERRAWVWNKEDGTREIAAELREAPK